MTDYGVDTDRHALVAMWSSGLGNIAHTAADLPDAVSTDQALLLTHVLNGLSRAAWRTYTHPGSPLDDAELDLDGEGWERTDERAALADVVAAIRAPNLPEDGMLLESYSPVIESAHRVGRELHGISDLGLTEQLVTEVEAELAAIEAAERGDLTGRARQAVRLTRADASPLQVAAADALLQQDPLGSAALFSEVDATAASVAAAHWLQVAAEIAAEMAETAPTEVVIEADDLEPLAVDTPTLVLERLANGESPRQVVTDLVGDAMAVADGRIPDVEGLMVLLVQAGEDLSGDDEDFEATVPDRITPLDPVRPAHDLLEDLLDGIRGCWLLYRAYEDDAAPPNTPAPQRADRDKAFFDRVRKEAAAHQDRLL
ncbi:hypothetical protein NLX83_32350 [Allokutzneria sp. A3M-2-11 16]|uniref:hypothetical protein n=1 Tax=Allokutzneria sp. A3M-2-11 16 TaxID=2962043 RepID=UPI0020B8AF09|nr:hypothetical protein [Allokutzneria sp. A3M-2-11 16]MCP3803971.1 hypothetical protein [Allokutzneria sp. A3M-2-11 16]